MDKNGSKNWLVESVIVFLPPATKMRGQFLTKHIEIHAKAAKKIKQKFLVGNIRVFTFALPIKKGVPVTAKIFESREATASRFYTGIIGKSSE